jgi:hypothetical protein
MLHENPLMEDIDVDHWRNLQSLILESAKGKRRIIVIHEDGKIMKFVHSGREEIVKNVDKVDDPHDVAARVYADNAGKAEFVAVFERHAFDTYFGRFQDTWRADEDLDEFVHRTYAMMDDFPDGIVTHPGPARATLGLQWRVGASHAAVKSIVGAFAPTNSTVVLGVFDGDDLWATLVLGFGDDRRINAVTTVDPAMLTPGLGREAVVDEVTEWAKRRFGNCSLALFTDRAGVEKILAARDKGLALRQLAADGVLLRGPVPAALDQFLAAATPS